MTRSTSPPPPSVPPPPPPQAPQPQARIAGWAYGRRLAELDAADELVFEGLTVEQEIRSRALTAAAGIVEGALLDEADEVAGVVLEVAGRYAAYIATGDGMDRDKLDVDDPLDVVVTIPLEELIERGCRENPEFAAAVERTRAELEAAGPSTVEPT